MAPDADWPQALRELVGRAFGQCADAQRGAVSAELKRLIFEAVQDGSLHTRDWARVRLASLGETRKRRAPDTPTKAGRYREDPTRRELRQRRFEAEQAAFEREQQADRVAAAVPVREAAPDPNVVDWDAYTVVGTSTKLEKPYLRLTSAPDPKTVRPLATLRRTLALLTQKWASERNYDYMCDQLKSVRQDLTVQHITNEFTVRVYEMHARLALDMGDLGEYNQCQSQLRVLYAYDLPGSRLEFLAYRILYLLHTRQQRDVHTLMAELSDEAQADVAVRQLPPLFRAVCACAEPECVPHAPLCRSRARAGAVDFGAGVSARVCAPLPDVRARVVDGGGGACVFSEAWRGVLRGRGVGYQAGGGAAGRGPRVVPPRGLAGPSIVVADRPIL